VAGDHDKTVSCSCPAPKSKNFVSRGKEHSAALRVPFRLGSRKLARPVPLRQQQCSRRWWSAHLERRAAPSNRAAPVTVLVRTAAVHGLSISAVRHCPPVEAVRLFLTRVSGIAHCSNRVLAVKGQ
jgi:hypothetical protein